MAGIAAVSVLVKTVIKIPLNKRDQCKSPVDNAALLYCRALSVAKAVMVLIRGEKMLN